MRVRAHAIHKTIAASPILRNVTLELIPGAVNGIIGPNGAGKTTLLRLLGLLDQPERGEIHFDDRCVFPAPGSAALTAQRRRLGFVFQHPLLLNGSVYHNLVYPMRVRGWQFSLSQAQAVLARVGLEGLERRFAPTLSGGEKQRLQLARAMLCQPELLLLDEPTSNIDPQSTRRIEELLREIAASGTTVVLTTHNLIQARAVGDHFFFFVAGQLVQQGPAQEIFSQPLSRELADFAAVENIWPGELGTDPEGKRVFQVGGLRLQVSSTLPDGPVTGTLRAESILLSNQALHSSARHSLAGTVSAIRTQGSVWQVVVRCQSVDFTALILQESAEMLGVELARPIFLTFKATALHVVPTDG